MKLSSLDQSDADKGNEIKQKLNQWNYSKDMSTSNRYYRGRPLSLQEQSDLSRARSMLGFLRTDALFKSKDFRKAEQNYQRLRAGGVVKEGTRLTTSSKQCTGYRQGLSTGQRQSHSTNDETVRC